MKLDRFDEETTLPSIDALDHIKARFRQCWSRLHRRRRSLLLYGLSFAQGNSFTTPVAHPRRHPHSHRRSHSLHQRSYTTTLWIAQKHLSIEQKHLSTYQSIDRFHSQSIAPELDRIDTLNSIDALVCVNAAHSFVNSLI